MKQGLESVSLRSIVAAMYKILGIFFVGLALVGAVLPVLPTTPFLILAASCFAKSSKEWYDWLMNSKIFGPTLREWENHRSIPLKAKVLALSMIIVIGGYSLFFRLESLPLQMLVGCILAYGIYFVARIPTRQKSVEVNQDPSEQEN